MPPHKIEKEIDLMEYEIDKPNWLSPAGRWPVRKDLPEAKTPGKSPRQLSLDLVEKKPK